MELGITRMDHVSMAVWKLEDGLSMFTKLFGMRQVARFENPHAGYNGVTLDVPGGGAQWELLEPAGAGGPISKFLDRRGPGLHHLAFAVQDVSGAAEKSRTAGFPCVAPGLRTGSRGRRVCFLDPRATHGVLIELVEAGAG